MTLTQCNSNYKRILRLGFPMLLGQLGIIATGYIDTMLVGHFSTDALAASSFVGNVFNLVVMLSLGFSYGLTPLVGAAFAQNDTAKVGTLVKNAIFSNGVFMLICMAIMGILYLNLNLMKLPESIVPITKPFYLCILASMLPMALSNALRQFVDAIGDTKVSMWILLSGNALNIVLCLLLIWGHLGFPQLGLLGAGIATLIARTFILVAYVGYVFLKSSYAKYCKAIIASRITYSYQKLTTITSLPIALQIGMETAIFAFAAIVAGWIGRDELAAYQVLGLLSQLGFMIFYSFGSATSIVIAQYHGVGDTAQVRDAAKSGYIINLAYAVIVSIFLATAGTLIADILTSDANVILLVSAHIIPLIAYQLGDATQVSFSCILRGIAHVKPVMSVAFLSYIVIGTPALYLLAILAHLGLTGIYLSFTISLFLAGALFCISFYRKIHASKKA